MNHFVNLKTGILLIVCLFAFVACGGGDAAPTVATETTTSAEAPKAETQAEAPPVEAQIEEVVIESSAVSVTNYQDFGFSLSMESGAMANTMAGSTDTTGTATFNYGGVNAMLNWVPGTNFDPVGAVKGLFTAVQNSNTATTFRIEDQSGNIENLVRDGSNWKADIPSGATKLRFLYQFDGVNGYLMTTPFIELKTSYNKIYISFSADITYSNITDTW